jgi:multidrug efflux pump subunit AcrB
VRQGFYGEQVQRLPRDGEDVRVFVRYPSEDRQSLDYLQQMRIRTSDGREVPISAVAELSFEPGIKSILRRERQRAAVVSAEAPAEIAGDIRRDLNENFWKDFDARHPTVTRGTIGQAEGEREFMIEFLTLSGIALGIAYFLVAIAFRSYGQPFLILFAAIPFCFMGAVTGHLVMGHAMSIFSILGIVAAAGVAVNDNLVLIDYVNRLRDQGMGGAKALIEAGTARFRPILLTSITTFVGLVPLMMERSIQAKFLIPVGIGLAYGVMSALFVTLFFVPALYAIGADIKRHVVGAWTGRRQPRFGGSLDDETEEDALEVLTGVQPAE